jgi:predicted ferric reductase
MKLSRSPSCGLIVVCMSFRLPSSHLVQKSFSEVSLYMFAVVLLILWVLGLVSSYTMGGFIHVLLAVALIMILLNFIFGRKRLT